MTTTVRSLSDATTSQTDSTPNETEYTPVAIPIESAFLKIESFDIGMAIVARNRGQMAANSV